MQGALGSVRLRFGAGTVQAVLRFSVPVRFLCKKGFSVFQYSLTGKDGSGSSCGSWKTVPAVPVPLSVSGKTVPTVPVSGSGSVPEPPCFKMPCSQYTCRQSEFTRYATTLNFKAGLDCRGIVNPRQGLDYKSVGILQQKRCTTGKKALAYRGNGGQNTDTAFLALREIRGGSLPSKESKNESLFQST